MSREGRLVKVTGGSRVERGEAMGKVLGAHAKEIYELKVSMYKPLDGMLKFWDEVANASKEYIKTHAPVVWEELQGFATAKEVDLDILLKLSTEYEMLMKNGHFDVSGGNSAVDAGKCTAMATTANKELGNLCAQSNDENPSFWLNAKHDVIIHNCGVGTEDLSCLVYTHPGYPGYMGMNSAGVCVLWQYIDNGERECTKGVPTCVILREILKFSSAKGAVEWLRSIPRTLPNNYILCDAKDIFNVECSPKKFTALHVDSGEVVHANHCVFDQQMMGNDLGLKHSLTSKARHEALLERVRANPPNIESIKKMFSTAPLLRVDGSTLANMIFQPKARLAHMRFKGDDRSPLKYVTYKIPEEEWTGGSDPNKRPRQSE